MADDGQQQGEIWEGRVGTPLYGGTSIVSGPSGQATALPFLLEGELARIGTGAAGTFAVLEPSLRRVEPGCVHFRQCGGCQYQHAAYAEQLAIKQHILEDLLTRAGLDTRLPVQLHAADPWGYRNRIRLRLELVEGVLRAGYNARATNQFLPVTMCPIAAPILWRAVEQVLALAATGGVHGRWLAQVSELELFTSGDQSRLQVTFLLRDAKVVRNEPLAFAQVCEVLKAQLPQLAGAGAQLDPELSRRTRRSWPGQSWGAPGLSYEAAGGTYWVTRGSFFQVNRFLVARLVELALAGETGAVAWDLFAGVGLFSQHLLPRFREVIAVEIGSEAVADLAQVPKKLTAPVPTSFQVVATPVAEFLKSMQTTRKRPELVVLDPPRSGLGVEAAADLARIGPSRIVYVSCDPETLVRDLAVLCAAGYSIRTVDLVDLFPQTFHMETVVHLARG